MAKERYEHRPESGSLCAKEDFRSEFTEISKAIHLWKAYNIRSPKTNVYTFAQKPLWAPFCIFKMAAIRILEYLAHLLTHKLHSKC